MSDRQIDQFINAIKQAEKQHNEKVAMITESLEAEKVILAPSAELESENAQIELEDPREIALVKLGMRAVLDMFANFPLEVVARTAEQSDEYLN